MKIRAVKKNYGRKARALQEKDRKRYKKGREEHDDGSNYGVFCKIRGNRDFCDSFTGIFESAGLSGRSDYAACGYLGGERPDSFCTGFDYHCGGGAYRKPYFILAGI